MTTERIAELESLSRKFCKLVGIEPREYWWCSHCLSEKSPVQVTYYEKCTYCGNHVERVEGPDFTDAREVIAIMRLLPGYEKFYAAIGSYYNREFHAWMHREDLLATTGLMLKEAVEWMKGREK